MKILPLGVPFKYALRLGYTGEIRMQPYIDWIKTLPCATCDQPGPSDPSHPNFFKSMKAKGPDALAIPECRKCHNEYERYGSPLQEQRLAKAALVMLQAIAEGRLVWKHL